MTKQHGAVVAAALLMITNVGCCYTCYCQNGGSKQFTSIPGFAQVTCALNCASAGTGVSGLDPCTSSTAVPTKLVPIPEPE